MQPYD